MFASPFPLRLVKPDQYRSPGTYFPIVEQHRAQTAERASHKISDTLWGHLGLHSKAPHGENPANTGFTGKGQAIEFRTPPPAFENNLRSRTKEAVNDPTTPAAAKTSRPSGSKAADAAASDGQVSLLGMTLNVPTPFSAPNRPPEPNAWTRAAGQRKKEELTNG